MADTFEAKGKRKKLVEELRQKGIVDEDVLRAIDTVPRHLFMDPAFLINALSLSLSLFFFFFFFLFFFPENQVFENAKPR